MGYGKRPGRVEGLTRYYGKWRGVVDLTFEVGEGEIFGFLGPNGAGKTTTIRQLMGLMRPTSGSARVFGLDCWKDSTRVKKMVGFLPGDIRLYEKMTGEDLLDFFAAFRGVRHGRYRRELAEQMQQLMGAFPKSVMEAFGANNMGTLAGWVGGKYLNVMWPLIMSVFVIMAGAATVAREVERGTIELLLSVPESRTRLLAAKLAALFAGMVALVAATVGSIALGAGLVDEALAWENLLALGAVLLCFGVAVAGYSVLLSSFSKERSKPAGMAAGLTLAFYVAWVVSDLSNDWEWLKNISIFTAFDPQRALQHGHVEFAHLAALVVVGVVSTVVALVIFNRRDAIA